MPEQMKTNSWTTAGQAKDISSSPNPLVKVLRRGRHWVWGPNRRRAIKEWSIAINNDWVDNQACKFAPEIENYHKNASLKCSRWHVGTLIFFFFFFNYLSENIYILYVVFLTPLHVLSLICLYISSHALSKVFEHRNFVARYGRETNHICESFVHLEDT